jgi:amino acid transporter
VFCYWGWDAAFSVNEETRPRDASRAGLITLVTMLGLFLLGSIAFQRVPVRGRVGGPRRPGPGVLRRPPRLRALAALPLVALMFSAVASLQAGVIPTARGMLAMGRDRTMGPVWGKVSPATALPPSAPSR